MVRTQIQLSEEQSARLKKLAAARGKSVAELIRTSVDALLAATPATDDESRRERALSAAGRFHTGDSDLAEAHDRYLAEAYAQ